MGEFPKEPTESESSQEAPKSSFCRDQAKEGPDE
jgi:hypothetical protein